MIGSGSSLFKQAQSRFSREKPYECDRLLVTTTTHIWFGHAFLSINRGLSAGDKTPLRAEANTAN